MLLAHEYELPHMGRRINSLLQSPADVTAILQTEVISEECLAAEAPEIPARMSAAVRESDCGEFLKPQRAGRDLAKL